MASAPPTARELAVRVLRDIERRAGFSNRILSEHLERQRGMAGRDRGLTTVLVYGVLRHRLRLDAHIDRHARRPAGLRGNIREALRIGAFERLELGRPAAIAVTETTKLIRKLDRSGKMAGAAQAILSAIDRTGEDVDAEFEAATDLEALERRWSIPRWLGGRWIKRLGPTEARARARALARPPAIDLRVDLSRTTAQDVAERLLADHPGCEVEHPSGQPQALRIRAAGDVFYGPVHDEGLISVQGLAAQQAAIELAPKPGMRVLDACAGMGVKTLHLAELMQRSGAIVCAELESRPLAELPALIQRGRLDSPGFEVTSVQADVGGPHPALDDRPFDAVLLDVPCTGLGNLARHPEIRYVRKFDDIAARGELQERLLRACLPRVVRGGSLLYAVCSFAPEEGPDVIDRVLATSNATKAAERTFTPERDGTEGFYIARLVVA